MGNEIKNSNLKKLLNITDAPPLSKEAPVCLPSSPRYTEHTQYL